MSSSSSDSDEISIHELLRNLLPIPEEVTEYTEYTEDIEDTGSIIYRDRDRDIYCFWFRFRFMSVYRYIKSCFCTKLSKKMK